jgi:2-dehydropantoate 2-reductase
MKGRRTEIDYINGAVCAKATKVGVAVPCQHAILELVKRMERGELSPARDNISGI